MKPLWSPARVAEELTAIGKTCSTRAIQAAIDRGELRARPVEGPTDTTKPTWAVEPKDALSYEPRRAGRPRIHEGE